VESLYLLVPLSVGLVLMILGVFAWALHGGQFDDLEGEAARILDESAPSAALDGDQAVREPAPQESRQTPEVTAVGGPTSQHNPP
jgi:cbb3-type cytochrome oxidase maturation protein